MTAVGLRRLVGVSLNAAIDKTAAVDALVPGAIHRPRLLAMLPGGKAVNVVRAARHLGLPGSVVAVLGGHAGAWYREALRGIGIPVRAIEVGGETRTCLSVLDESTGRLTEFYEAGVTLSSADWPGVEAALAAVLDDDAPSCLVVLAGSLPPGAPVHAYGRLARIARSEGARAVVDVAGEPLDAALEERPWLVKVNAGEAATVTGVTSGTVDAAVRSGRALTSRGAELALVTRGVHGAVLVTREAAWSSAGVPQDVRGAFSVGSGDALLAGFAAAVARGLSLRDALGLGVAAGAANAATPGQGELDPELVARVAARIEVREAAIR